MHNINQKIADLVRAVKLNKWKSAIGAVLSCVIVVTVFVSLIKPALSATSISSLQGWTSMDDVVLLTGTNSDLWSYDSSGNIPSDITVSTVSDAARDKYLLGLASMFSIFTQSSITVHQSDSEGRVATGGGIYMAGEWAYDVGSGHYYKKDDEISHYPLVTVSGDGWESEGLLGDGGFATLIVGNGAVQKIDLKTETGSNGTSTHKIALSSSVSLDDCYAYPWTKYSELTDESTKNTIYPNANLINFSKEYTTLKSRSKELAEKETDTKITIDEATHTVTFDGGDLDGVSDTVRFNISAEDWAKISAMTNTDDYPKVTFNYINIPKLAEPRTGVETKMADNGYMYKDTVTWDYSYIVVNVEGTDVKFPKSSFKTLINGKEISVNGSDVLNNNFGCTSLLYNLSDATSVTLGKNFQGTILAPNAAVTDYGDGEYGHLSGALIAQSFDGYTEFGYRPYTGPLSILESESPLSVEIFKTDANGNPLKGAEFGLYTVSDDGTETLVKTFKSGDDGTVLSDVEPGKYMVKEIKAPDGYIKSDEKKYFEITQETVEKRITIGTSGTTEGGDTGDDTGDFNDLDQTAMVQAMGAGWNLGNQLEANSNGTPSETAWGNPTVTKSLIQAVKNAGFKTIRIPVSYLSKIGSGSDYTIDSAWLNRVKEVVDYAIDEGLYVIVNMHGDGYTTVDGSWLLCNSSDQTTIKAKYKKCWEQIATKFKDYDEHLIFESMNEEFDGTYGTPNTTYYANINAYNQVFVDTVRQTGSNNAKRWLLIPGWNTNIDYTVGNYGFEIPTDSGCTASGKRLMISVHYYDPWDFCGDESKTSITQWGETSTDTSKKNDSQQEDYMASQFASCYNKFFAEGYPVIIGEYGSIDKTYLDSTNNTYRAYYAKQVCLKARQYGMVPVYWDNGYNGNNGYGLFDRNTNAVTQQGIIDAINEAFSSSVDTPTSSMYVSLKSNWIVRDTIEITGDGTYTVSATGLSDSLTENSIYLNANAASSSVLSSDTKIVIDEIKINGTTYANPTYWQSAVSPINSKSGEFDVAIWNAWNTERSVSIDSSTTVNSVSIKFTLSGTGLGSTSYTAKKSPALRAAALNSSNSSATFDFVVQDGNWSEPTTACTVSNGTNVISVDVNTDSFKNLGYIKNVSDTSMSFDVNSIVINNQYTLTLNGNNTGISSDNTDLYNIWNISGTKTELGSSSDGTAKLYGTYNDSIWLEVNGTKTAMSNIKYNITVSGLSSSGGTTLASLTLNNASGTVSSGQNITGNGTYTISFTDKSFGPSSNSLYINGSDAKTALGAGAKIKIDSIKINGNSYTVPSYWQNAVSAYGDTSKPNDLNVCFWLSSDWGGTDITKYISLSDTITSAEVTFTLSDVGTTEEATTAAATTEAITTAEATTEDSSLSTETKRVSYTSSAVIKLYGSDSTFTGTYVEYTSDATDVTTNKYIIGNSVFTFAISGSNIIPSVDGTAVASPSYGTDAAGNKTVTFTHNGTSYSFVFVKVDGGDNNYLVLRDGYIVAPTVVLNKPRTNDVPEELKFVNYQPTLKLLKTDDSENVLEGSTIELYRSDDTLIYTWTDFNGICNDIYALDGVGVLPAGDYYFVETVAPNGYELPRKKLAFTIADDYSVTTTESTYLTATTDASINASTITLKNFTQIFDIGDIKITKSWLSLSGNPLNTPKDMSGNEITQVEFNVFRELSDVAVTSQDTEQDGTLTSVARQIDNLLPGDVINVTVNGTANAGVKGSFVYVSAAGDKATTFDTAVGSDSKATLTYTVPADYSKGGVKLNITWYSTDGTNNNLASVAEDGKVEVNVTKVARPEKEQLEQTIKVLKSEGWEGSMTGLPLEGDHGIKYLYSVKEVIIPGYNCVPIPQSQVLTKDSTVTFESINKMAGTIMPETGGDGTTVFIIAGALLIFCAAVIYLVDKRHSKETFK